MSWPRFTYVVELNIDSVRNTDPQRLGLIDIRPHYVSTRVRVRTRVRVCISLMNDATTRMKLIGITKLVLSIAFHVSKHMRFRSG